LNRDVRSTWSGRSPEAKYRIGPDERGRICAVIAAYGYHYLFAALREKLPPACSQLQDPFDGCDASGPFPPFHEKFRLDARGRTEKPEFALQEVQLHEPEENVRETIER
jgi:hypothetical protein